MERKEPLKKDKQKTLEGECTILHINSSPLRFFTASGSWEQQVEASYGGLTLDARHCPVVNCDTQYCLTKLLPKTVGSKAKTSSLLTIVFSAVHLPTSRAIHPSIHLSMEQCTVQCTIYTSNIYNILVVRLKNFSPT